MGDGKDVVLDAAFVEEMESIVKFIGWKRTTIISSYTLKVFPLIFYNQEIVTDCQLFYCSNSFLWG